MVLLPWEPFEDPAVSWEKLHGQVVAVVETRPEGVSEADWRIQQRCKRELKRKVAAWKTITNETVTENHTKVGSLKSRFVSSTVLCHHIISIDITYDIYIYDNI